MAYYFHRATLVSLPANVLAVPLTEIIMVAAIAAVSASYLTLAFAKLPAIIAAIALHAMNGSVRWLGALRIADTRVPTPQLTVILLGACALVLAMVLSRRQRWLLVVAGWAALVLSAFWVCAIPPHPQVKAGVLELTAIDVGQGDSILLVSPQGHTLSGGCRRHTVLDAFGIGYRRRCRLAVPLVARVSSTRCSRADARSRRSHGRHGGGAGEFSSAGIMVEREFAKP